MSDSEQSTLVNSSIDKFWEVIPPLWHGIRAHIAIITSDQYNLTVSQFHILRRIAHGKDSVSQLADDKHISKPAVSRAVDLLVNKGFISRWQDPDDRRHVHLYLTDEGKQLLDTIFEDTRMWMRENLSVLNVKEVDQILHGLDALSKAFPVAQSKHHKHLNIPTNFKKST